MILFAWKLCAMERKKKPAKDLGMFSYKDKASY